MSRIDIGLGRHGPFHDVRFQGRPDDPVLWMEVPGAAVLCLTAKEAKEFTLAVLGALEAAEIRKPQVGASEVTRALLAGTLGIAGDGVAVPEAKSADTFPDNGSMVLPGRTGTPP